MTTDKSNLFKPSLLTVALFAAGMSASIVFAEEQETQDAQAAPITAEELVEEGEATEPANTDNTTEEEGEGETLIITGYRGSLIRAADEKRHADTVTEQVTADDLGSLPDASIADALTRLPGVSAIRTGGKASEINIRGLSGLFVHTTLNGREQVSTSGSRSVEFAQYPSELISGATVYKSQKASLIEGGVAGTVDLKTASPLSNKENHIFSVNARGMFNDRADEVFGATDTGHRFSFSYQGKFADDTVGIALGYARLFEPSVATQFIGFDYARFDLEGLDTSEECTTCESVGHGFELQHRGGETTRDGYVAIVEWAPTDTFILKADVFLSKYDEEAFARGYRVILDPQNANISNPVLDGSAVIGADVTRTRTGNTLVQLVNDNNVKVDEIENYGLNGVWDLTERFTLTADISHSSATSNFRNGLLWGLGTLDSSAATPVFDDNVAVSYRLNGLNTPDIGFNQDFSDVNNVMLSKYGIYPFEFTDALTAFKIDGTYAVDNSILKSIEAGVRYSERKYSNRRSVFEYGSDTRFSNSEPPLRLTDDLATVVNWGGGFSNFPSYLAIDYNSALSAWFPNGVPQPVTTWGADSNGVINNSSAWSVQQSGRVWEDVLSGYISANIDMDISDDLPLTGNVGLRIVQTDQSATTLEHVDGDPLRGAQNIVDEAGLVNSDYAPGISGEKYTDYLPQINLNFHLSENNQIRFAAARVLSRSPINRLAASANGRYDSDDGEYHYNRTNSPSLKPFLAEQYDLSFEHYFEDRNGYVSVAIFQKQLKSFVQEFTIEDYDFAANGFTLPEYVPGLEPDNADGAPPVLVTNGSFTEAVNNANGGYFRGLEFSYMKIFTDLPGIWSELGVSGSYAYTESEIDAIKGITTTSLGGETVKIEFPGLSANVVNGAIFWGYLGFETRINMRHRSKFNSSQIGISEQQVFFAEETVFDYQASYQFNEQLSGLFQVINVTDQPTQSFFGQESQTGTIQYFGRQFFLGVNYKL